MTLLRPSLDDRAAFAAYVQSRSVRRVGRSVGLATVLTGAGFWVVFAVVAAAIPLIAHRSGHEIELGALVASDYIARWVAFGTAAATFATILVPHLAAGGTRRALRRGVLGAAVVTGLVNGVLRVLVTLGERELFGVLGWTWRYPEAGPMTGGGTFTAGMVAEALAVAVYVLVACAVVAGYHAHGVWPGTLLLLPGIALLLLVELATRSGLGDDLLGTFLALEGDAAVGAGVLGGLAVVGLAAAWLHLQLRDLRLRPTR